MGQLLGRHTLFPSVLALHVRPYLALLARDAANFLQSGNRQGVYDQQSHIPSTCLLSRYEILRCTLYYQSSCAYSNQDTCRSSDNSGLAIIPHIKTRPIAEDQCGSGRFPFSRPLGPRRPSPVFEMVDYLPTLPGSLIWDRGRSEVRLVSSPFSSSPPIAIVRDIRPLLSRPARLNAVRHATVCCSRASERLEAETAMQRSTLGQVAEPVPHATGAMLPLHADSVASGYEEVGTTQPAGAVAALAVLLSRLPALETLEIRTFDRAEDEEDDEQTASLALGDPVISLLCREMLSAATMAFAHVRTARVVVPYPDDDPAAEFGFYVSADTVLPLFYLPQVRTLEMHRV
ncbi:hypothetical protein CGGC5_v013053 [Colletotrichum fructicola Nara gc5]|uniref:Uncharacterized protein n=1 Tax=Colletotrichum fructicola (strain Nara gc5) TaxID=1213859 RepID=A0A7J6IQ44_COLFN|nr:hypothetical protein CGGC5_v013053 [Colletotrichum fructicola Nara gc5]